MTVSLLWRDRCCKQDCISSDNAGSGFTLSLHQLNASSDAISITVRNLTVAGGQSEGLVIGGVRPGVRGSIDVSDSLIKDTWGGSGVYDKATDGAPVHISRCRFENVGTHPAAHGMSHSPLIVYGSGSYHGDNRSYDCGGVTFTNVSVVDSAPRAFIRGDVPPPRIVRDVRGSISVINRFGCNASFGNSAVDVAVAVRCNEHSGL